MYFDGLSDAIARLDEILKEIVEDTSKLYDENSNIEDGAKAEGRELTPDEDAQIEDNLDDLEYLNYDIDVLERVIGDLKYYKNHKYGN